MIRTIKVSAGAVELSARIDTNDTFLTRGEVERIRDSLADKLQEAVSNVPYIGIPRNRVVVR